MCCPGSLHAGIDTFSFCRLQSPVCPFLGDSQRFVSAAASWTSSAFLPCACLCPANDSRRDSVVGTIKFALLNPALQCFPSSVVLKHVYPAAFPVTLYYLLCEYRVLDFWWLPQRHFGRCETSLVLRLSLLGTVIYLVPVPFLLSTQWAPCEPHSCLNCSVPCTLHRVFQRPHPSSPTAVIVL